MSADRLDELHVVATIIETGSLTAAARRLRRSPPAISRVLAALEERVGVRLIERTTRQLMPTQAGSELASQGKQLLAAYEQLTRRGGKKVDSSIDGVLRVTAPSLFGRRHIAPLVAGFLDQHPQVRVELVLTNRNLDLVQDGLDVALRIGFLTGAGFTARRVGHVRWMLVASPDYLARKGRPRTPKDLRRHDVVYHSLLPSPVEWRFRSASSSQVVRLSPRLMINDIEGVIEAVRAGRGLGRALSYQITDHLASGDLIRLLREYEPPDWPVHLVVPSVRHMPPAVRAFLDLAAPALSRLPAIHLTD